MTCNNSPLSINNLGDECKIFTNSTTNNFCKLCNDEGIFDPTSFFFEIGVPNICISFFDSVDRRNLIEYEQMRKYMNLFFEEFNDRNCKISNCVNNIPTECQDHSDMQNTLYYVCSTYGGICDYGLNDFNNNNNYSGICKNLKKDDILDNKSLSFFCGCHLDEDQYVSGYDFSCDTLCLSTQSIKRYTESGQPIRCNQPICIISNVSVNVYESDGSLNFSQLCGNSCTGNLCAICIMQDISINDVESLMDINFLNSCGNSSSDDLTGFLCYETIDGQIVETECKYTKNEDDEEDSSWMTLIIIIFSIVGGIILIGIIILIIIQIRKSNEYKLT